LCVGAKQLFTNRPIFCAGALFPIRQDSCSLIGDKRELLVSLDVPKQINEALVKRTLKVGLEHRLRHRSRSWLAPAANEENRRGVASGKSNKLRSERG
jgi:hypothetical protein